MPDSGVVSLTSILHAWNDHFFELAGWKGTAFVLCATNRGKFFLFLRPFEVQFLFDCLMGLKDFNGCGCILADDMGLGKTLQHLGAMRWSLGGPWCTARCLRSCEFSSSKSCEFSGREVHLISGNTAEVCGGYMDFIDAGWRFLELRIVGLKVIGFQRCSWLKPWYNLTHPASSI